MFNFQIPLQAVLIAVLIHSLWGGNPIAAKFSLEVFPPFASAMLRFVLGIVAVGAWAWFYKVKLWPETHEWTALLVIGLLFTAQIALMNIGIDKTTGIMAVVLISTNPLFAALFAHYLIAGDKLTATRCVGLFIAFIGVCLTLINPKDMLATDWLSAGIWISLASAALLGFRLVISANALKSIEPARVAIWQMAISIPIYALASWSVETIRWENFSMAVVWGLLYQGVIVAGIGFMVSFWLMKRYQPGIMMSFNFVSPVAGVLLASWLLDEQITYAVIAGVILVAIGLLLIARKQPQATALR